MGLQGEYEPSSSQWVRDHVELYESSFGAKGNTMKGKPVVVLTTVGAKSKKIRKSPLMRVKEGDQYAVVASQGGAPDHPAWYHNIVANPLVELQDGPIKQVMKAEEATGPMREHWWKLAVDAFSEYADYQAKTERTIPIFILTPVN